ncbi:MAG: FAD-dependent monooxygenase [Cyclobacteriaceae bacterium]
MKIGIIGGGITGLTTALALHKSGIPSVVFEQANDLNAVGAGIWLQPNAIKVLDWLGVKEEIKKQGKELNKLEITDNQLVPFKKIKSKVVQDEAGNRTIAIHRTRLHRILYEEVLKSNEVHLNRRYVNHSSDGDGINLQFENGGEKVDVLLGADGIDSSVRKALFPKSPVRNSGQVCWRGVSKMNLPDALKNLGQEAWGKQIRFGFSPIFDGEVYWFAVANAEHLIKADKLDRKEYIAGLFQDFSPVVTKLIANTESTNIHEATLHDFKETSFLVQGQSVPYR